MRKKSEQATKGPGRPRRAASKKPAETERRQAEEALQFMRISLDNATDTMACIGRDGRFVYVNNAFCRIVGYPREELLSMTVHDIDPDYQAEMWSGFWERLKQAGSLMFESCHRTKDGRVFPVEIIATFFEYNGREYHCSFARDITERKRAEAALRESEGKYRNLVETINDVIFAIDARGALTYVSPAVKKVLEYEPDELIGRSFMELVYEEDRPILANRFADLQREVIEYSEYRVIDKRGKIRWVRTLTNPIIEGERFVGARGTLIDISARKQAEEKLKETLEELRKAFGGIIEVLSAAVEKRDPYTAGHQRGVADLARAIAQEMGLDGKRVDGLRMAGSIHDLGKLSVPAEILSKPGRLTAMEFRMIQTHPQTGWDILNKIDFPWPIREMILQHHERMNGSGYPQGLKGEDIRLEARILAVADVMEAMASHRPYRPALGIDAALAEIENNKGVLYDLDVAAACLRLFREKDFSFKKT
ncbi:MAG: PAS domain S-box protein [Candidatus Aminicenantes bacterium]|nr:PAS domain S-box protein [Candidatus Aminicenantes bacterium]